MAVVCAAVLMVLTVPALRAQQSISQSAGSSIVGTVVSGDKRPVANASVLLRRNSGPGQVVAETDRRGVFRFSSLQPGTYQVSAEKSGLRSLTATVYAASAAQQAVELTLLTSPSSSAIGSADAMDFADQPSFAVAGVTDWTAVGGHGSDAVLRTSEELARVTAALKPGNSEPIDVNSLGAPSQAADLHRRAGEAAEHSGDPLHAAHEYEQAARLDPSEQNYFDWGSELLVHRAVWQAVEVFGKGSKAYPNSARMLAALGAALFASARYDDAALRLCGASDLNPKAAEPYILLGKVAIAAPTPLPCIEQELARFLKEQPDNPLASYYYAMALLKGHQQPSGGPPSQQVEALLTRATVLDPKCGDAWLQLGTQAFSRGNIQRAISLYTKAIQADPELGEAHYRLGVAYDRLGKATMAKREFQLHDEIERREAARIEQERQAVKQFLIVLQGPPAVPQAP